MFRLFGDIAAGVGRRLARLVQSMRLVRERRRLDRLYGPRLLKALPAPLGDQGQADVLARLITDYCERSQTTAATHEAARVKLDAADYAFANLIRELSCVMKDVPSTWAPTRATGEAVPVLLQRTTAIAA